VRASPRTASLLSLNWSTQIPARWEKINIHYHLNIDVNEKNWYIE
jgi:hypothetical protein